MHRYLKVLTTVMVIGLMVVFAFSATATELKYEPRNPSFGGSALNGSWMMDSAKTQDPHGFLDEESSWQTEEQTDQEKLEEAFLRRLRYELVDNTLSQMVDEEGALRPGTYQMGDNLISIDEVGGQLEVTLESETGQTTITVPK
jgi:curli production assembly/transport component CsgF